VTETRESHQEKALLAMEVTPSGTVACPRARRLKAAQPKS